MAGLSLEHIENDEQVPEPQGGSALAKIRALYERAKSEQHLDLPLPMNPLLKVRYVAVDPDELGQTAKKQNELYQDVLIAACQTFLMRNDDGEFEPLTYGGEPVRFDQVLSELLGLGVPPIEQGGTAREVVLRAFSTAPQPLAAIANHFLKLAEWMSGEGAVDEESLLGES